MNEYFKAATKRFTEKDTLIHPISTVDAEIIGELYEIFKKFKDDDVVEILKNYKFHKDSEILDKLLELNIKLSKELAEETEPQLDSEGNIVKPTVRYILMNQRRIDMFQVISYDGLEEEIEGKLTYCLKLNPTPEKAKTIPMYANEIVSFKKKKDRDYVLYLMDIYLAGNRGLFLNYDEEK